MNPYIVTRYGHKIHYLKPDPKEFDIRDICHALSRIVRFNGHTAQPYHVAQHLCHCSDAAPEDCKREAFAHDWAESFVGDCPAPLKILIPQFSTVEERMERTLARKFGFRYPYPAGVKETDMRMLVTEMRDLTPRKDWKTYPFAPLDIRIEPWSDEKCRREFMKRFNRWFK